MQSEADDVSVSFIKLLVLSPCSCTTCITYHHVVIGISSFTAANHVPTSPPCVCDVRSIVPPPPLPLSLPLPSYRRYDTTEEEEREAELGFHMFVLGGRKCAAAVNECAGRTTTTMTMQRKEGWKVDKGYIRFASLGRSSVALSYHSFSARGLKRECFLHGTVVCLAVG